MHANLKNEIDEAKAAAARAAKEAKKEEGKAKKAAKEAAAADEPAKEKDAGGCVKKKDGTWCPKGDGAWVRKEDGKVWSKGAADSKKDALMNEATPGYITGDVEVSVTGKHVSHICG